MAETVWAIYENGKLRLLEPLDLRDGQRVRIQVVRTDQEDARPVLREERQAYTAAVAEQTELDQDQLQATAVAENPIKALLQKLIREGRLRPRPSGPVPPDPVSKQERLELAEIMGQAPGKPLSEIMIEERGER